MRLSITMAITAAVVASSALVLLLEIPVKAQPSTAQSATTPDVTERQKAAAARIPIQNARLQAAREPGNGIRGSLEKSGRQLASFRSSVKAEGNVNAAVSQVRVGNLTIDARRNLQTEVTVSGAGGQRITAGQKRILVTLVPKLYELYGPPDENTPPQENLLLRAVNFYSEAPVGYPLEKVLLES